MSAHVFVVAFGCMVHKEQYAEFERHSEEESFFLDLTDTAGDLSHYFYDNGFGAYEEYGGEEGRVFVFIRDMSWEAILDVDTTSPRLACDEEGEIHPEEMIVKRAEFRERFAELSRRVGIDLQPKWQNVHMFIR